MADKAQVELLLRGSEAWNDWRGKNPDVPIDLRTANLTYAFLYRANLSDANLSSANLSWAYLQEANLSKAMLYRANLSGAFFGKANLSGVDLREVRGLTWERIEGVIIDGTTQLPDYLGPRPSPSSGTP